MYFDRAALMTTVKDLERRVDLSKREPYALPNMTSEINRSPFQEHPDDEFMDCLGDLNSSNISISDSRD